MRRGATSSERQLWKFLRGKGLFGLRWRRQHPHRDSILDFYCPALNLAIELDGDGPPESKVKEAARRKALEAEGVRVLAFGSVIQPGEEFWEILAREVRRRAEEHGIPLGEVGQEL